MSWILIPFPFSFNITVHGASYSQVALYYAFLRFNTSLVNHGVKRIIGHRSSRWLCIRTWRSEKTMSVFAISIITG